MNHRPVAIGMVLCEQVIIEEGTHNVTPVNCFSVREVAEFPGEAGFVVLAWLTDGLGEMQTELVVERLDDFEEIFRLERKLNFPDRVADLLFSARIRNCPLSTAAMYQVSLWIDGELIATRRFRTRKKGRKS